MSVGIDELLGQAVATGAVPGVVAVAADGDGVCYEGAAGTLSTGGGGAAVDRDTMFRIASMTKAVASVAALQLVEQGRLMLDQRVATVVPEFAALQVLDGFDGDTPRLRAPASEATILQLLTHTSGVGYWITNPDLVRYHELTGAPLVLTGLKDALFRVPLVDDPGRSWNYGASVDWLGLAVEAISGLSLDHYLAEFVLGPLGMTETSFSPTADQRRRLMPIHARMPDGALVATELDWPQEVEFWPGGGGLYGTGADYLRFLRALCNGGELDRARILEPETVELMFTNQIGDIQVPREIPTGVPELTNAITFPEGLGQTWGAGLHLVTDDLPGMRRAGTGDWAGIANSYYWIDRCSGVSGAIFTQVVPFFDLRILELAQGFEAAVYARQTTGVA